VIKIDSCSLIYASKLDLWDIIIEFFDNIGILDAVYDEVVIKGKIRGKPDAFIIEKKIKEKIIQIIPAPEKMIEFHLGRGETETIIESLDEKVQALIDDKKALLIGSKIGVQVLNLPLIFLKAYISKKWNDTEFNKRIKQWGKITSASMEQIYFLKKIKNVIKNDKFNS